MKKILQILSVVGTMLGVVSAAYAADSKSFPGTMCTTNPEDWVMTSSGSPYVNGIYTHYQSVLSVSKDLSFGTTQVLCPVMRDDIRNTNGLANLQVTVGDVSSTGAVSCMVSAMDSTGAMGYVYGPYGTSVPYASGALVVVNMPVSNTFDSGNINISCLMPGSSSEIASYTWSEFHAGTSF